MKFSHPERRGRGVAWRTYRIVVEVPVLGPCTSRDVVSAIADAVGDLPKLDVRNIGRVRVKYLPRVETALHHHRHGNPNDNGT